MQRTIYLDETGHFADRNKLHVGVAGFLAPTEAWGSFNTRWKEICSESGCQQPFHMVDFAARRGQFADYSEQQRQNLLKSLMSLICSMPRMTPIGSVVCMQAYRELSAQEKDGLGSPYYIALAACIRRSALNFVYSDCKVDLSNVDDCFERVNVVLAKHPEHRRGTSLWDSIREKDILGATGMFMGSIVEGIPLDDPGLQAADLIAYEMGRYFNYTIPNEKEVRWPYKQIVALPNSWFEHVDKKDLLSILYAGNVTASGLAHFCL